MVIKNSGPLAGVRIANASQVWAGPHGMQQFADMGAEVIRIESVQVARGVPAPDAPVAMNFADKNPGLDPWNRSLYFNDGQVGMLGVTMDLSRPEGRELLRKLVLISDFFIENFAHGVMDKLGAGYEVMKSWKPDIIYVSAPGYGNTGPDRNYVAYGTNQLHMTGLANITGYADGGPMQTGINYGDPTAGIQIAGVVLAAMLHRKRTGKGLYIDVSQREAGIMGVGEYMIDYQMNGRTGERIGNRNAYMAPHGCYPSKGDDMWLTIAVGSDEEWKAFCKAIGSPEWTKDAKFGNAISRWKNQDEMDAHISAWTKQLDHNEAMHILQRAGVAAGAVLENFELFDNPQNISREFYQTVDHPSVGPRRHPMIGWRMSKTPGWIRRAAPTLGQDNEYVYKELLGISQEEYEELERKDIIGTIPLKDNEVPKAMREARAVARKQGNAL
ncbi:MAG: CoA transferase [Candidatus Marsarchaeota archaeon]|nr:CoA transferase [Candidatus Marsarchaeota archaeon]